MSKFLSTVNIIFNNLTAAFKRVFINSKPLKSDRTSCVSFVCRYADFRTKSVPKSVCKTGRGIMINSGRIYSRKKPESTAERNLSAEALSSVIIPSVWPEEYVLIWSIAASTESTNL